MRKQIFFLLILSVLVFSPAKADTNTQTSGTSASTSVSMPAIPAMVENIHQAKQLLANTDLNYALNPVYKKNKKTGKSVISSYSLDAKDFAIAILDPATGQIQITKAMQKGKTFTFPDTNFDISQSGFNGVNTQFQVNKPANGVVLAIKYLITGPEKGSKQSILSAMSPAIYVPYTKNLDQYEVAKYGEQYLNDVLQTVASQLSNVPSQSIPGQTITQAIKPSIIKALLYAEHMDTTEFLYNPDTQVLIDKVNILYAGNEGDTFKYSVSSGNARGIAQFIPSTYKSLVSRHPEIGLNPDFVAGMSDHVNAIKAEYLLIDDYIAAVHQRIPNDFNPAYILDYGAASYNGGVARVAKAVQTYGQNWYADQSGQKAAVQDQISAENSVVAGLKSQLKRVTTKAQKSYLNSQLAAEKSKLTALQSQLSAMRSSALKNETVLYLEKMHKLIQIFNAEA